MSNNSFQKTKSNFKRLLFPVLTGGLISFLAIYLGFSQQQTNFQDVALGRETTSVFLESNGYPIHCSNLKKEDPCLAGYLNKGQGESVVLWFGNSQLHAINQYNPGQETSTAILHRELEKRNLYLITYSQPNANLQEHYVLFEYLTRKLPVKKLILPVVFDDTRELGIRNSLLAALVDQQVREALSNTEIGLKILSTTSDAKEVNSDLAGLKETVQERTESYLNDWLAQSSDLWRARSELRGQLFLSLYQLRNTVFNINPTTKRKIIKSRYHENIQALEAILNSANDKGISTLLYIVPIRNDVELPYDLVEYKEFKKTIDDIATLKRIDLLNLENLVPARYWGQKENTGLGEKKRELDFMHFQAAGHELLANALFQYMIQDVQTRNASGNK